MIWREVVHLDAIDLPSRLVTALRRFGITTLNHVSDMGVERIGALPGVGAGGVAKIRLALEAHPGVQWEAAMREQPHTQQYEPVRRYLNV